MSRPEPLAVRESQLIPLFPTFVWKTRLAPATFGPMDERIMARLAELQDGSPPLDPGYTFQTDQDLHLHPDFQELSGYIQGAVRGVLEFLDVDYRRFVFTGCWANVSAPGARHMAHSHPNNFLSGVYYVRVQDGADKITFEDPRPQPFVISPMVTEPTLENASELHLTVEEGVLLVFPAWLRHRVGRNESPAQRVSVSFNVMFPEFEEGARETQRQAVVRRGGRER